MTPIDRLLATLVKLDPIALFMELAEAFGSDPSDAIAEAESDGMVESYEVEGEGLAIVLTPYGAERCGVELREVTADDYRWVAVGTPETPWRSKAERSEYSGLIYAVSPEPGPVEQAIANERAERAERRAMPALANGIKPDEKRLPRPTVFLGSGFPWQGPPSKGPCRICRGLALTTSAYCLECDRWGLDHLLIVGKLDRPAKPKPKAKAAKPVTTRKERRKVVAVA